MQLIGNITLYVDDKHIPPGEIVDLEDAEAESLIARGLAFSVNKNQPKSHAEPSVADVAEAILQLDEDVDYTKDGLPNVDSLANKMGVSISADLRNKAFEYLNSQNE